MTFDEFTEAVLLRVRMVGRGFTEPDDDWMPVAIFDTPAGVAIAGLPPELFNTSEGKTVVGEQLLPGMARSMKATKAAFISSAWMSLVGDRPEVAAAQMRGETRPSDDPQRIEIVNVAICDPEVARAWIARIIRSKRRPPTLGEWQSPAEVARAPEDRRGWGVGGLMIDDLAEALR